VLYIELASLDDCISSCISCSDVLLVLCRNLCRRLQAVCLSGHSCKCGGITQGTVAFWDGRGKWLVLLLVKPLMSTSSWPLEQRPPIYHALLYLIRVFRTCRHECGIVAPGALRSGCS